ncbi:MAG TPA: S9 family peptidase [Solirubrobacteraceae bacterium]|nr:S9 family peptidase [Solirubrobacteraceae bacterium]
MGKRLFRAEDALQLKSTSDPDLSPDGRRVAFVLSEAELEKDRLRSAIWVVPVDGSEPPRPFSEGPADRSPRFSPDGKWLAYISVPEDHPERAHVRLAPLDGGIPAQCGELPGAVTQLAWSPDSRRIVVVCRVGAPVRDEQEASERNAPRLVRGLGARLDGVGWHEGRRHLFLIDVADGSTRQLTRGDFDHDDPSFSPDGENIVFASDRHPRRDDRQLRRDAWIIPASGGRRRRLTDGTGRVAAPAFSPDGSLVAFAGQVVADWDAEPRFFVVAADGSGSVEPIAPEDDRPVPFLPGLPAPFRWTGDRELVILLADRGSFTLRRARVGQARSRELVGGDIQIDGVAVRPGRRPLVYTAAWIDQPSELYATTLSGSAPGRVTHFNDAFVDQVELAPTARTSVVRPDGTEVEYLTIAPSRRRAEKLPLHLDVHGGPHGAWPSSRSLALHQALAAAGYLVLLPNPRGSTSYGQEFTSACTGDWGGGDYEDIIACCDDLVERGLADPERMFVSGGSYGGFMTAWIVGHTDRFRAGAALAAVIDMTSMALTTDVPEFSNFSMGGTPWDRRDEYDKRSPLTYLPRVNTPVLVVHWEGDIRVPIGQGEELYTGLRVLGKEAEFLRYPGGFHISRTPSQAVDFVKRLLDWNRRHDPRGGRRRR